MARCTMGLRIILAFLLVVLRTAATPPGQRPRIGVLTLGSPPRSASVQVWRQRGWVAGHHVLRTSRGAAGQARRLSTLAADLVHRPVDVLAAAGTPAIQAAEPAAAGAGGLSRAR